ncbi:MAG TPA: tyrosine-type recombinase/integrase, partial [Polyangiaceae bacterium]
MGAKLKRGYYWRGGVIWVRSDPVTKAQCSTRCRDPKAAEVWRAEREKIAANPDYAASLTATLGNWVLKVLEKKRSERAAGTVHMYEVKLGHLVRLWGADLPLVRITAELVDEYIKTRSSEGAKNNTIARELTGLRQILRHAKRGRAFHGTLDQILPVGFSSEYVPVKRTLDRADLPKLWDALRDDTERAWVGFVLATAADVGDVERALPTDYDAARNVVRIRGTKTETRDDEIPILPHVQELFDFARPHLPISWPRASKGLGEACKRAGIPHLSPKDLRRTAASWLIAAGADQRNVGRFLRHKSDAMVRKVYGQLTATQLGSLLESSSKTLQSTHGPLAEQADAGDLKGNPASDVGENSSKSSSKAQSNGAKRGERDRGNGTKTLQALRLRKPALDVQVYVTEQLAKAYPHAFDGGDLSRVLKPLRRAAAALAR